MEYSSRNKISVSSFSEYKSLIENLPVAVYTCDGEGRISFFNEAAAQLWGGRPVIGVDLWSGPGKMYQTDGTPIPIEESPMTLTLKQKKSIEGSIIIIEQPDGKRKIIQHFPQLIFDAEGIVTGSTNMLLDITDKFNTEHALRDSEKHYLELMDALEKKVKARTENLAKSEEQYHKMVEAVQDYAILLLDRNGTILNWNKGAEKIKGYSESEIVGKNFRLFYCQEDRENGLPEMLIEEAITQGKSSHEGWRIRKDHTLFWGSVSITALHDENNQIIGFSKVTRDLTKRKEAERELERSKVDLELRNEELEQFAYVASHDLQEPVRKIRTFSELVEKDIQNSINVKKYIAKINKAAERMTLLINDILSYSRLSKPNPEYAKVDLNIVIENVMQDFELMISQRNATINYSNLPSIPGIPVQLHQLFSNLIQNALKFNDGNPVINISSENISDLDILAIPELHQDKKYIKIKFHDNGIGIEPQYQEQIFKLFQRLNHSISGTGIGLSICKKVVENHNGFISVLSALNQGTTFTIFLPQSVN